jgi:hypothetical protein
MNTKIRKLGQAIVALAIMALLIVSTTGCAGPKSGLVISKPDPDGPRFTRRFINGNFNTIPVNRETVYWLQVENGGKRSYVRVVEDEYHLARPGTFWERRSEPIFLN